MSDPTFRIGVIGGGIAGLYAAHLLRKKGHQITLFEREDLGGKIQTKTKDGELLECGPNTFSINHLLESLLIELNLYSEITYLPKGLRRVIFLNNKLISLPKDLFISSSFSLADKLTLLKGIFLKKIKKEMVLKGSVFEVFEELFNSKISKEVVATGLRGIIGGDIRELHFKSVFPGLASSLSRDGKLINALKGRESRKPATLKGGGKSLINSLRDALLKNEGEILTQEVKSIQFSQSSGVIDGREFDQVIIACPEWHSLHPEFSALAQRAPQFCPIISSQIRVPVNVLQKTFGVLFSENSYSPALGILCPEEIRREKRGEDQRLVFCFGGTHGEEVLSWNTADIQQKIQEILGSIFNQKEFEFLDYTVWEKAIPQYGKNHPIYLEEVKKLEERFPFLTFIGPDMEGIGIPGRLQFVAEKLSQIN